MLDLTRQRVAVVGKAGHRLDADDELAAGGARVGDRDRCLDAELVAGPRLALGDAFDLGGVQGIKLVLSSRFWAKILPPAPGRRRAAVEVLTRDLAADVAVSRPARSAACSPSARLLVPTAMDQP